MKWDFTGLAVSAALWRENSGIGGLGIFSAFINGHTGTLFAKMLDLRKKAGRQCDSRLWGNADVPFSVGGWKTLVSPDSMNCPFIKIPIGFIMTICSGREEEFSPEISIIVGLQYEAWMLEIRIPDWLEFPSKEQALKYGEQAEVSVFLKAEAIFLLFDGSKEKIFANNGTLPVFT